jgi:hypothetical protein
VKHAHLVLAIMRVTSLVIFVALASWIASLIKRGRR